MLWLQIWYSEIDKNIIVISKEKKESRIRWIRHWGNRISWKFELKFSPLCPFDPCFSCIEIIMRLANIRKVFISRITQIWKSNDCITIFIAVLDEVCCSKIYYLDSKMKFFVFSVPVALFLKLNNRETRFSLVLTHLKSEWQLHNRLSSQSCHRESITIVTVIECQSKQLDLSRNWFIHIYDISNYRKHFRKNSSI